MKFKVLIGLLLGGATLMGIGRIVGGRVGTPPSPTRQGQSSLSAQDATPVQEGVMNDRQKQHSRLFSSYKDATQGRTLHQLVLERGDIQIGRFMGNVRLPASFDMEQYLGKLSCDADLIVIGTVRDRSSNLIEDGTFTFTEHSISTETVLKDNPAQPVQSNTAITVVRVGGKIKLLGHVVNAVDSSEKPLVTGGRYLLFLKFIPTTGAYKSLSTSLAESTFKVEGNQVTQVSDQHFPFDNGRSKDLKSLLAEIGLVLRNPCA